MQIISPERVRLTAEEARGLACRALERIGYDEEDSHIIADHLIDAALCGYEYSGLPKLLNVAEHPRLHEPRRHMRPVHETPMSVLYDGGNNVGMVTMYHAAHTAVAKARNCGFGIVGVHNSWVSGRGAYYVEIVGRADLIGIHPLSSTRRVAPPGGARASYGTNPIAFAFPTAGDPLIIDMGTSALMATDMVWRMRRGEQLPEGVALDAHGRPTRDPATARKGALLSFGEHKGFALAMAMQGFGVLAGSGMSADKANGFLIMAVRPDLMMPLADYKRDMGEMLARIKSTQRQPGIEEIRIPSERSYRERARQLREGIVIDRRIHDAIASLPKGHLPEKM